MISVPGGAAVAGVNITVGAPAAGAAPNVEVLGVTPVGSGGSASNSGATIARGTTMRVLLFGAGLDETMQVSVSGPSDITIANVRAITSTSGRSGLSFEATVAGNAALGGRTVIVRAPNNNVSVFTGGLEVTP